MRVKSRRLRAVVAIVVTALVASMSLALSTGTANAAAIVLQISGDAAARNTADPAAGPWTFGGDFFGDFEAIAEGGTFGQATFDVVAPVTTVTDDSLAGIDVYISSAVSGGYSPDEEAALQRFVQRGGVLLALSNQNEYDVTDFLGAALGPNVAADPAVTATATSVAGTTLIGGRPPTITLTTTYTHFTVLPAGAQPLYEESALPVVAVLPFGTIGAGAVIMTTDSDVFAGGGLAPGPLPNPDFAGQVLLYIGSAFSSSATLQYPTYVNATYLALLDRPSDPAGNAFWSSFLAGGAARSNFAFQIAKQPEWVNGVVSGLYQDVFGRAPDSAGLAYWVGQIQSGLRVSSVAAEFYASAEFFNTSGGGTVPGWVTAMYQDILGRAPDQAGLDYWVGQINAGVPATQLAASLYLSLESNVLRVDDLYQVILNRAPDPGGRLFWGNLLVSIDDIALAAELVASEEFFTQSLIGALPPA